MPPVIRTVVKKQIEYNIGKKTVNHPSVLCGRERKPYYGQRRADYYTTALFQDRRSFDNERATSHMIPNSPKRRQSQLSEISGQRERRWPILFRKCIISTCFTRRHIQVKNTKNKKKFSTNETKKKSTEKLHWRVQNLWIAYACRLE